MLRNLESYTAPCGPDKLTNSQNMQGRSVCSMPGGLQTFLVCFERLAVRKLLQLAPATWETPGKMQGPQMRQRKLLRLSPWGDLRFETVQPSPHEGPLEMMFRFALLLPLQVQSLPSMHTCWCGS